MASEWAFKVVDGCIVNESGYVYVRPDDKLTVEKVLFLMNSAHSAHFRGKKAKLEELKAILEVN